MPTSSRNDAGSRAAAAIAFVGAVFAGGLTSLQSRVNGEFGEVLGNGILTSLFTFGTGLLILLALVFGRRQSRHDLATLRESVRTRVTPFYMLLGGLGGAFFVVAQSSTVGVLGVALFTLGVVAGQVATSVWLDHLGFGPRGKVPASELRIIGASLAMIAVVVAVWSNLGEVTAVWMIAFALVAGIFISWQTGANGNVNKVAGSSLVAALVNFTVGTVALVVATSVSLLVLGMPTQWPSQWWLYTAGPLGVIFIAMASQLVRTIGVLLLGLGNIAGQLIAALLLDAFVPVSDTTVGVGLFIGSALSVVALLLAGWRQLKPARE